MLLKIIVAIFLIDIGFGQEVCRTPNGNAGTCTLLETCTPLLDISKKTKKTAEDILFLRQSNCGLHLNIKPKVCCPPKSEWTSYSTIKPLVFPTGSSNTDQANTSTPQHVFNPPAVPNLPPDTEEFPESSVSCPQTIAAPDKDSLCCGIEVSSSNKILNGRVADIDQYPWLALIEYNTGRTSCGASLISSRYVLTAAHCIVTHVGTPTRIRLSEYNTTSYPTDIVETQGGGFEEITVLIIPIEKNIVHPEFKKHRGTAVNDIALVKMTRNAPYTDFIRPICLPYEDITTIDEKNLRFFVAGWGSNGTVFSDVKQYVDVPYVPFDKCQTNITSSRNKFTLSDTQLCAGGEEGRDSCSGDSGGPLMHEIGDTYVIVGIVSFGDTKCGKEGVPAIYTHVYKYLEWLRKEMV